MANNPHVDLSGDIRDFRRALSRALSQKLYDLEKETGRLEQILEDGPDKPAEVIGSLGGIPILDKAPRRSRIGGPNIYLSAQKAAEQFPERKALIESFLKNAAEDDGYVQDCFLLRSTLQYAVIRKEIVDLSCDYDVLKPYTGKLPSSDEIAAFLVDSYGYEKTLTRDILTTLANRHSALPLLDAVCDNPSLHGKKPDWSLARKAISDAIVGLGSNQVAFRKDMSAIMISVDYHVFRDLGGYISTAKKISRASLSRIEFPLNEDQIEMLQFGELVFSTYPEGKDEYLKALTDALHEAEEKGYISAFERCAVTGEATPAVVAPNGEEPTLAKPEDEAKADEDTNNRIYISINATHVEQTTAIQNNQQINIINCSATGQTSPNEEAPANRSDQGSSPLLDGAKGGVLTPALPDSTKDPILEDALVGNGVRAERSNAEFLTDGSLLPTTPGRFEGKEKEFKILYGILVKKYVLPKGHDEDNWCKLFMLGRMGDSPLHKMEWQSTKEELRCFTLELYKPDKVPSRVNNIFYLTGKPKDKLKLSEVSFPTKAAKDRRDALCKKYSEYIKTALGENTEPDSASASSAGQ